MGYQIPTTEPFTLTAGDTWTWKKSLSDFPYSDGWRLSYSLRGAGKTDFSAGVDTDGQTHLVSVDATETAELAAGDYTWASYVAKAPQRFQVGNGTFNVKPNLAAEGSSSAETRSFAKQMVDALRRVILKRAEENDSQYMIGTRSIIKLSPKELRTELGIWEWKYRQELVASGQLKPNTVGVVFARRH